MKLQKQLLIIALSFITISTHSMQNSAWQRTKCFFTDQRFADSARTIPTALFFGYIYTSIISEICHEYRGFQKLPRVRPEVEKFVRETLKEHHYSENFIQSLPIKEAPFFAACSYGITVPITTRQLHKAQALQNNTNSSKNNQNFIRKCWNYATVFFSTPKRDDCESRDKIIDGIQQEKYDTMSPSIPQNIKDIDACIAGLATHEHALSLWKGFILHEASHYKCHDMRQSQLAASICPIVIHMATKKIPIALQISPASFLPVKLASTLALITASKFSLGKYHE